MTAADDVTVPVPDADVFGMSGWLVNPDAVPTDPIVIHSGPPGERLGTAPEALAALGLRHLAFVWELVAQGALTVSRETDTDPWIFHRAAEEPQT